ncbi:MAG: YceI family protein [Persicimonas sp.]
MKLITSKRLVATLAVFIVGFFGAKAFAESHPVTIDEDRSEIDWESDAPAEKILGEASGLEGTLKLDLENPEETSGKISFPVDSMKTGNSTRDKHLQSKAWLDAKKHPDITFEVEKLEDVDKTEKDGRIDIEATVVGTVEVKGVKNEEKAKISAAILPDKKKIRVQPELEISLDDYKVKGRKGGTIGRDVAKTIEIEGVLYGKWE